jgi:inhibitor of KinA
MPLYDRPRFLPAGDMAITVELADDFDPEINARVRALSSALEQEHLAAILDLVPTYRSLLVYYDPLRISVTELQGRILSLASVERMTLPKPRVLPIPVVYGGAFGPDLDFVSRHTGLSPDAVADIHAGSEYLVYMLGFNTSFPYLGGMSPSIAAPRLETPRTKIPAGSIGIAQQQTGIYPVESPGGWQIIGRSPVRLFDPTREPPMPIGAGDFIRFVRIDEREYRELETLIEANDYRLVAAEKSA